MAISIEELVTLPHLRLTVVAGAAGVSRVISWAHASDLNAPWAYLAPGELLLANGMGLPEGEDGQVGFVDQLEATRVAAFGLGTSAAFERLEPRALQRFDELRLPLLRVPDDLPFVAIARAVADANQREEHRRLALTTRIYDLVRRAAGEDQPAQWLLNRLAGLFDCSLVLLQISSGSVLFCTDAARGPRVGQLARDAIEQRGSDPEFAFQRVLLEEGEGLAVPVPANGDRALVSHGRRLPPYALLQHAAAAVAIELTTRDAEADRRRAADARLVDDLLGRRIDAGIATGELHRRGLTGPGYRVTALRPVSGTKSATAWLRKCEAWLERPSVAGLDGGDIVMITDDLPIGMVADAWPADQAAVGHSGAFGSPSQVPDAVQEARWAIESLRGTGVAEYARGRPLVLPPTKLEADTLVADVLGRLLAYDEEHASSLVPTMAAFFENERSWRNTATALSIHRQTVVYRLQRVEELTGRRLRDMRDLTELYVAITAHAKLQRNGDELT